MFILMGDFAVMGALTTDAYGAARKWFGRLPGGCLLYTSDAADDLLCVDLGGRPIYKKKKK